jgi:nitrite reductase/ring-hydroxylating ferredoxin subunit
MRGKDMKGMQLADRGPEMPSAKVEVFAICGADDIERGDARPFSLSRINEAGESRPFPIVVVRTHANGYFGYVNSCPHEGIWLNFGDGTFFTPDRAFLRCGRHGSIFEIETGLCIDGKCKDQSLQPIALAVVDSDVCVCGIALVEDDGMPNPFDELDDTMEIMIHPD